MQSRAVKKIPSKNNTLFRTVTIIMLVFMIILHTGSTSVFSAPVKKPPVKNVRIYKSGPYVWKIYSHSNVDFDIKGHNVYSRNNDPAIEVYGTANIYNSERTGGIFGQIFVEDSGDATIRCKVSNMSTPPVLIQGGNANITYSTIEGDDKCIEICPSADPQLKKTRKISRKKFLKESCRFINISHSTVTATPDKTSRALFTHNCDNVQIDIADSQFSGTECALQHLGQSPSLDVNIKSGIFHGDRAALYHTHGQMTINDGDFTGSVAVGTSGGKLCITDGTFNSTEQNFSLPSTSIIPYGAAIAIANSTTEPPVEANISGGTFSGPHALFINSKNMSTNVNITGGTFDGVVENNNILNIYGGRYKDTIINHGTTTIENIKLSLNKNAIENDGNIIAKKK